MDLGVIWLLTLRFGFCLSSSYQLSSVQSLSHVWLYHGLQHARPPCLSPTPSLQSVMPSNHLILCRPLLFSPSIFPSIRVFSFFFFFLIYLFFLKITCSPSWTLLPPNLPIGLFQWVSSSHQVAKVLEFQLQHQSFQWIFRTDVL